MKELTFEKSMRLRINQTASKNAMSRLVVAHNENNELTFYASVSEL